MKPKPPLSDYAKYSAIGLQMAGFIVACTFGGKLLDNNLELNFPAFTVTGIIIGVFGSMYFIIKKL
ncbi:MAG: AtpZ/AtpI family protein [Bacteroidia bacterium]